MLQILVCPACSNQVRVDPSTENEVHYCISCHEKLRRDVLPIQELEEPCVDKMMEEIQAGTQKREVGFFGFFGLLMLFFGGFYWFAWKSLDLPSGETAFVVEILGGGLLLSFLLTKLILYCFGFRAPFDFREG